MRRARATVLILASCVSAGCHHLVVLGDASDDVRDESFDSATDAVDVAIADTPPDAVLETATPDVTHDAPDARAVPTSELTGLDSWAPALALDDGTPAVAYRMYYMGLDGALWLERRSAVDHSVLCQVSLGRPSAPYDTLAGAPTTTLGELVVVLARTTTGNRRLFARQGGAGGTLCGHSFAAWEQLPVLEPVFVAATAPAAAQFSLSPARSVVVLTTVSGAVVFSVRDDSTGVWGSWSAMPALAANEHPVSRPALLGGLGYGFEVGLVVETTPSERRLRGQFYDVSTPTPQWLPEWTRLDTAETPASALAIEYDDERFVSPVWFVYSGVSGHLWATSRYQIRSGFPEISWTDWADLGAPLAGSPTMPALGFPGNWRSPRTDLFILTSPRQSPRRAALSRRTSTDWSTTHAPWSTAPGGMQ